MEKEKKGLSIIQKICIPLALAGILGSSWGLYDTLNHHKPKINAPKTEIDNFTLTATPSPINGYVNIHIENKQGNQFHYSEYTTPKYRKNGEDSKSYSTLTFTNGKDIEIKTANGLSLDEFTKNKNGTDTIINYETTNMKDLFKIE